MRTYQTLFIAGIEFATATLAGLWIGNQLDERWLAAIGWAPTGTIAGVAAGFAGGLVLLVKILQRVRTGTGND